MKKYLFIIIMLIVSSAIPASASQRDIASPSESSKLAPSGDDAYQYVKTVEGYAHAFYMGSGPRNIDVFIEKSTGKYVVVKWKYLYPQENTYDRAGDKDISMYRYMVVLPNTQWTYFFNL